MDISKPEMNMERSYQMERERAEEKCCNLEDKVEDLKAEVEQLQGKVNEYETIMWSFIGMANNIIRSGLPYLEEQGVKECQAKVDKQNAAFNRAISRAIKGGKEHGTQT